MKLKVNYGFFSTFFYFMPRRMNKSQEFESIECSVQQRGEVGRRPCYVLGTCGRVCIRGSPSRRDSLAKRRCTVNHNWRQQWQDCPNLWVNTAVRPRLGDIRVCTVKSVGKPREHFLLRSRFSLFLDCRKRGKSACTRTFPKCTLYPSTLLLFHGLREPKSVRACTKAEKKKKNFNSR